MEQIKSELMADMGLLGEKNAHSINVLNWAEAIFVDYLCEFKIGLRWEAIFFGGWHWDLNSGLHTS
jgi:hypothetical protein